MKTMRKIDNHDLKIQVEAHHILSNGWEYYETPERFDEKSLRFGLVMGFETELGYFDSKEIAPYVRSTTKVKRNDDLMPASGWEWVE